MPMTSSHPYLVRAMYQWISDNGLTPYLLVDATIEDCMVPVQHIRDGKIILNIAPMAVNGLILGDETVTFSAKFSGKSESIYIPVEAVLAIYARENGQGMMFAEEENRLSAVDENQGKIKEGKNIVSVNPEGSKSGSDPDKPKPPSSGPPRPNLHVVK